MAPERQPRMEDAQRESAQDNSVQPAIAELGLRDIDDPAPQGSRAASPCSVHGPQAEVNPDADPRYENPTRIELQNTEPPVRVATAEANPRSADPMYTLVQGLINQLNQRNTENPQDNANPGQVNFLRMVKTMRSLGTQRFKGGCDPLEADAWLQSLEKNFGASRCPEEFKLDIAVYYLEKDAANWWLNISNYFQTRLPTYSNFKYEFRRKYFPPEARDRLESQFMDLEQGTKSVREFEVEFTRLRRYTHYGQDHEDSIIRKFMKGLRPDIKSRLQAVEYHNLYELVERAVNVEEGIAEERAASASQRRNESARPNFSKSRFPGHRPFGQGRFQKTNRNVGGFRGPPRDGFRGPPRDGFRGNMGAYIPQNVSTCHHCGQSGHAPFACPMRRPTPNYISCFRCGRPGHFASSCPEGQPMPIRALPPPTEQRAIEPPPKRPAIAGRVYALGMDDPRPSQPDSGLITGTHGH